MVATIAYMYVSFSKELGNYIFSPFLLKTLNTEEETCNTHTVVGATFSCHIILVDRTVSPIVLSFLTLISVTSANLRCWCRACKINPCPEGSLSIINVSIKYQTHLIKDCKNMFIKSKFVGFVLKFRI